MRTRERRGENEIRREKWRGEKIEKEKWSNREWKM